MIGISDLLGIIVMFYLTCNRAVDGKIGFLDIALNLMVYTIVVHLTQYGIDYYVSTHQQVSLT